jgi:stearoyl-CoA desaturase (delta-9 desaturase)
MKHLLATMNDWGKLREEWYAEKKQTMMQKWEDAAFKTRFNEIDYRLKMQSKRVQLLMQQVMMPQVTAL